MTSLYKSFGIITVIGLIALSGPACAKDNPKLTAKHEKIINDFPTVQHISNDKFSALDKDEVIIFDIREADEYEVSHMEGAILVSPSLPLETFLSKYTQKTKGKTVLFYCSVGQRSSILAKDVQENLTALGSGPVYNLEGGLFKWHNDKLPLVTTSAETTEYIHPYNYFWGRMVNDKSKKRYKNEDK